MGSKSRKKSQKKKGKQIDSCYDEEDYGEDDEDSDDLLVDSSEDSG